MYNNNIYALSILYLIIIVLSILCAYYSEKKYNNRLDIKTYIIKEIFAPKYEIMMSTLHGTIYGFLELFILIYNYKFFNTIIDYNNILHFSIIALISFVISSIISIFLNITLTNIINQDTIINSGEIIGFIIGGIIAILIIYYS